MGHIFEMPDPELLLRSVITFAERAPEDRDPHFYIPFRPLVSMSSNILLTWYDMPLAHDQNRARADEIEPLGRTPRSPRKGRRRPCPAAPIKSPREAASGFHTDTAN